MNTTSSIQETTVGQLVVEQPSRSRIFSEFGIDYCCGGRKTLSEACREKQIEIDKVVDRLESHDETESDSVDPAALSLTELADHIEATHHDFLRKTIPHLSALFEKVVRAHGDRYVWLPKARTVYLGMIQELHAHMMKEEQMLFPMIRRIEAGDQDAASHCGGLENPIRVMLMEHDNAGAALASLRSLSGGYKVPEGVCNSFMALVRGLEELEQDMHQHVHKENNILFPRSLETVGLSESSENL